MIAFAGAALAGPALAQFGPPPPFKPVEKGPARVWNDQQWVSTKPVLSADLGGGDVGGFTGVLDPKTNQLCYIISAPAVSNATGARISAADPGGAGQTALALKAPTGGSAGDCVAVPAALAKALVATPANYVVEVDNAAYPNGGARAPLEAWDGVEPAAATKEARG